ncbi:eclosion hormone [Cydia pomonella]|uniref:Eclosion hormone n=1 Tax=Cydia pomonella TaxID=82600 RepID=A0A514YLM5_CYDPO|nr:eclosion hormone [Cydia pomonella]XP_061704927.1 eclosion hormone [Cydia pomonella]XP_061704928.1 eclosion hormone [Cydia pomonella]QDK59894.1 eclosion hormone [Cydia pomonella]
MSGKFSAALLFAVLVVSVGIINCSPAIASGFDPLEVCIENCAQCKKMLGDWFQGPLCAETCIKLRGKVIPECENFASISPFIVNKF